MKKKTKRRTAAKKRKKANKVTAPSLLGRPKRKFTTEQVAAIEQMALDNCHLDTIAMALSIPKQTLVRRFGTFIVQKRAEGRTQLRRTQRKLADSNTAMAIFLGKNELDQKDARDYNLSGEVILKPPTVK